MEKLRKGRLYGRFFAASREKLREMAERLKVRRLVNLTGCAVALRDLESQIDRLSHQAASHPLHFFPRDIGAFCRSFAF